MSKYSITLRPRISETDLVGHVNNVAIAAWFEDLRVRYMESLAGPEANHPQLHFTLASVAIDFVGETHYGSDVEMILQSVVAGNTSVTLEGEIHQGGKLTVKGRSVLVFWDTETRRPRRLPDDLRERIEEDYA